MRGRCFRQVSRTYRNTYVRWVCSKRNGQLKRLISKVEVDKDANVDVYLRLFNES